MGHRETQGKRRPGRDAWPRSQALLGAWHHLSEGPALHPNRTGPCPWLCPEARSNRLAGTWVLVAQSSQPKCQNPLCPTRNKHASPVRMGRVVCEFTLVFPVPLPTPLIFMSSVMIQFWNFKQLCEATAR